MNVTVFVVRFWGGQYREELILNITVFVVRVWAGQYRDDLLMNVILFSESGGRQYRNIS